MVSDVIQSTTATEAEIAAAAQEAQETIQREDVRTGEPVPGISAMPELRGAVKPLTYVIPPWDQGSWVMVWEMKLDANGEVYGDPTKAPRQQLGLWLQKKREDGGPRFSVEMPKRLRAEPTIPCLFNGAPRCTKKFYTRQDMVMHIRGYEGFQGTHPTFAEVNKALLDTIMARVADDNPRLAQMAEAIANMDDRGLVSVEVNPTPRTDKVDVTAGAPIVTRMGIAPAETSCAVPGCEWPDPVKSAEWSEAQKAQFLHTHTLAKHKEDI